MTKIEENFFYQQQNAIELHIRGRIAQVSSITEAYLARIILYCAIENHVQELINFKKLMFADKISKSCSDLKKANRKLQKENKKIFDELNSIRLFRNRMIHCEFKWPEKSFDSFSVWDIVEHQTDGQYYQLIEFKVKDVFNKIDEFKSLLISVLKIVNSMRANFNEEFPELAVRLNLSK